MTRWRCTPQGDVWLDTQGRIWHAASANLLPRDPSVYAQVPPQFHPPVRRDEAPSGVRFFVVVEAGHKVAELHMQERRAAAVAVGSNEPLPDRDSFYELWSDVAAKLQQFADFDAEARQRRAAPLTETEMGLVLEYARTALGYGDRGRGLFGAVGNAGG